MGGFKIASEHASTAALELEPAGGGGVSSDLPMPGYMLPCIDARVETHLKPVRQAGRALGWPTHALSSDCLRFLVALGFAPRFLCEVGNWLGLMLLVSASARALTTLVWINAESGAGDGVAGPSIYLSFPALGLQTSPCAGLGSVTSAHTGTAESAPRAGGCVP